MDLMLSSTAVIVAGITLFIALRNESPFHLVAVLGGMTLVIGLFFPLLSQVWEPMTWRDASGYDAEIMAYVQWDFFAFELGLLCAYLLLNARRGQRRTAEQVGPSYSKSFKDDFICLCLLSGGGVLYGLFIASIGLGSLQTVENMAEKYQVSRGLGYLSFGLNLVTLGCIWAEGGRVRKPIVFLCRAVAICVAIWVLIFIHVRTHFAILVLGYVTVFVKRRSVKIGQFRYSCMLLVVLGVFWSLLEVASLYRGLLSSGFDSREILGGELLAQDRDVVLGAIVGGSELSHPIITAAELRSYEEPASTLGRSYVESPLVLVPQVIFRSRPETPAEWFARNYYPELYARGGGTGFSLVGEAWLSFGPIVGPFLIAIVIGIVLTRLEMVAQRRPASAIAMTMPYFVFWVVMAHRAAWTASVKQVVMILLTVWALAVVSSMFARVTDKNRGTSMNPEPQ